MNVEEFHNRLRELYLPPQGEFTLIDVPKIRYAMIDGEGNPESSEFATASKWLYSLVHVIKPYMKERMGKNFAEPPLEYLFWAENEKDFIEGNKDVWRWRVMVVFTDWVDQDMFEKAASAVEEKLGPSPASLRLEDLHEGKSVQIMHVGEYEKIKAVCHDLYTIYLPENNLKPNGCYHEIYLNDPNRTAPHRRKVVIRQPVA